VPITAADVARLGWRKFESGQTVTPEDLDANYVRRTEAEMLEKIRSWLSIRRAVLTDVPAIVELERQTPSAAHWSRQQYENVFVHTRTQASERVIWVNEEKSPTENNHLVTAFLVAHRVDTEWELENVVVTEAERRKGIGRQLMQRFVQSARAEHATAIHLEVRLSNSSARAFYEKMGFTETGKRKRYYADPPEDAVIYKLSVPPLS
jgi:[ribosomal protein S18]-alanine N-acetyltransferase